MSGYEVVIMILGSLWCIFMYAVAVAVIVQAEADGDYQDNIKNVLIDLSVAITAPVSVPIIMAYEYYKLHKG